MKDFNHRRLIDCIDCIEDILNSIKSIYINKDKTRKSKLSLWDRIKLLFYIKVKYPYFFHKLYSIIKKDSVFIIKNPKFFIEYLTEFIVFLVSMSVNIEDINTFIANKFKSIGIDPSPITLNFMLDENSTHVNRYKIITKCNNPLVNGYVTKTIVNVNIEKMICNIEAIYYNTKSVSEAIDTSVERRKIFDITPSGSIDNPNYILDKELEKKDLAEYSLLSAFTIDPLIQLTLTLTSFEFKFYNTRKI